MSTSDITSDLAPSPADVNKNFIIRWRRSDESATFARLIGAGKYAERFGREYMEKHFSKAFGSADDRIDFRIRGRYIINFVSR